MRCGLLKEVSPWCEPTTTAGGFVVSVTHVCVIINHESHTPTRKPRSTNSAETRTFVDVWWQPADEDFPGEALDALEASLRVGRAARRRAHVGHRLVEGPVLQDVRLVREPERRFA